MNREDFALLEEQHRESGKSLKEFLSGISVSYSTYNYWRKKYRMDDTPVELAPITFKRVRNSSIPTSQFIGDAPSGATLLFPNGLRAHFGAGTESLLISLLEKSLPEDVLS